MRRVTRLERLGLCIAALVVALMLVGVMDLRAPRQDFAGGEAAATSGRMVRLSEFIAAASAISKTATVEPGMRAALEAQLIRVSKAASAIAADISFDSAVAARFADLNARMSQRVSSLQRQNAAAAGEALRVDLSPDIWFALESLTREQERLPPHGGEGVRFHPWKYAALALGLALLGCVFLLLREIRAWLRRARQPDTAALLKDGQRFAGRQALIAGIQHGVAVSLENSRTVGLVYVRLTNLPMLRERLGEEFSDNAVTGLLDQLRSQLRRGDLLARLDGDVAVVMLSDISSKSDLQSVASRVRRTLEVAIDEADSLRLTSDLGTAMYPIDGYSSEELIEAARCAMTKRTVEIANGADGPIYLASFRQKLS